MTLTNFSLTSLQGGSDGSVPTSWSSYFDKLRTEDIPFAYYAVPVTPVQGIHSELSSVLTDLTTGGYPMAAIVGGELGEPLQYTLSRKAALYSSRVSLLADDYSVLMSDGRKYNMPAYIATGFVAGLLSGMPTGTPLTFKTIRVLQSLKQYTSDELDTLYSSGVIVAEKSRNANTGQTSFRFTGDPTTMNDDNDPVSSTMSLREETDFLVTDLRQELDSKFIGTRSTSTTANDVKVAVSTFLLVRKNQGVIQDYDSSDIVASLFGDTINISFSVYPSRGIKKIIATMSYSTETQVSQ